MTETKDLVDGKERWTVPELVKYLKENPGTTIKIDKSAPEWIPYLTDAELVEAVAREVLNITNYKVFDRIIQPIVKWENIDTYPEAWRPFSDMNDLQMVKDKYNDYQVRYHKGLYDVCVFNLNGVYGATRDNESRAWLEVCLTAERGKG